ncbi:hypothetical protein [Hymenobacter bucti]|uniref:Uncharacterized protein n=1 Tax=Hymenobacter bucti TaxID=1844114 RepID=A0ABW4QX29_9BACT
MKSLLVALLLPFSALAQIGAPPPIALATHDSTATNWTLSLLADQRTFYLGREYGDHAYSLLPSITYSHPSGFYGTLSGYYFHASEPPRYAFTDLELGYANDLTKHWAYSLSYDRIFFSPPLTATDKLIPNGLEAYTTYDLGPLQAGLDYNFFFGKSTAQTIALALRAKAHKTHWLGFDEVSLLPGAEVLWGSSLALARYGGTYSTTGITTVRGRRKTTQTTDSQPMRLLGYELTLPLAIERGPFTCTLTGHYVVPCRTLSDPATPLPPGAYLSAQVDFSF